MRPLEAAASRPYFWSREVCGLQNHKVHSMIRIENLTKSFGLKKAVDDLSFSVERGEVLGFLGPNGAGKSTTMRMITGFLPPTAGKITIGGHDVAEDGLAAKRLIGYLPENAASYPDMTVEGFLNFAAELRGLTAGDKKKAVHRVVDLCFLSSVLHQQIDTLSKGYKHRTCLAQSIIHDPDVLIMDEPTDGLDPNQKYEVRQLIRNMGQNKAVIFSTHILEEVDAACTRAIIIDRGRIVANGTPEELRDLSDMAGAVTLSAEGADPAKIEALPEVARVDRLDDYWLRVFPKDKHAPVALAQTVMEFASRNLWKVRSLHTEEGQLDEVFRRITLPDTVKK
jgi:ABC-2 type transport system ATP-binding protein